MFFKRFKKAKGLTDQTFNPQNTSELNVASYSSKKEKIFTPEAKQKLVKKNRYNYDVKYMVAEIQQREKKTVSDTYGVTLKKGIGSGKLKTKIGVAKLKAKAGNVSADNLEVDDTADARMLARQVASWRIARSLNLRVLSNEKYGLIEKDEIVGKDEAGKNLILEKNSVIGISAMLPESAKSLSDAMKEQRKLMEDHNLSEYEMENYLGNAVFSGSIQKQLSDLQILDALTGQTDRHHGNIFIDTRNQRVYGIDNDQAFGPHNRDLNGFNAISSFKIDKKKADLGLEFTQNQIDANTAEKLLALDDASLEELMIDRIGNSHNESLNKTELEAAKKRLAAIKRRIVDLKQQDKLVKKWGNQTYLDSLNSYGGLAKEWEGLSIFKTMNANMKNSGTKYQNYIAREVNATVYKRSQGGYAYVGTKAQEYELPQHYEKALGGVIRF